MLFLTHRGFSAGQAGLALGLYGAGAVVGTLAGGGLSDRLTARTATLISMVGSAVLIVSIIYLQLLPADPRRGVAGECRRTAVSAGGAVADHRVDAGLPGW